MSPDEVPQPGPTANGEAELLRRVEQGISKLDAVELRRTLASPFVTEKVIRGLLADERAVELREVRWAIAAHPATPQAEAMRMIATLHWNELVALGRDMRARPPVRRAAHRALIERYEGFAVGVRVAIARRAGTELLGHVRHDLEPRVIAAMLENPSLTEGLLLPVLASGRTPPKVLSLVARSERWASRYQVRRSLCRNRRTPAQVALPLLSRLNKGDLAAIANDPSGLPEVRKRAGLLRGDDGGR